MQMVVGIDGTVCFTYDERLDLACLGPLQIRRASHVEPDEDGRWWSDLSPAAGPVLGPCFKAVKSKATGDADTFILVESLRGFRVCRDNAVAGPLVHFLFCNLQSVCLHSM
jgi:hypothetical protein